MLANLTAAAAPLPSSAAIREAVSRGRAAPARRAAPLGHCRVYVSVQGTPGKCALARALRAPGVTVDRARGLYVGYDCHAGDVLGRGEAIAAALGAIGLAAYVNEISD